MVHLVSPKESPHAQQAWINGLVERHVVAGSFGFGIYPVAASKAAVSNWDVVETLVTAGALTGYTFALTAGGGPACTYVFSATHYDSTLQTIDGATGWTFYLLPGSATGAGVKIYEDATLKTLIAIYEAGVSTRALVDAAILAGSSHVFVKSAGVATAAIAATEGTSHALNTAPSSCACYTAATTAAVIYFTNAVTTITVAKALAAANPAFAAVMTLSGGTGATVLATGDAIVADALTGGVAAVAITTIRGNGFTPTLTAAGTYRITVNVPCETIRFPQVRIQLAAAADQYLEVGAIVQPTATAKGYFTVYLWDISSAALVDLAADANNRINFSCIISRAAP